MLKAGTNKAGRTARQVGWVRQVGQQGRQAVTILWRWPLTELTFTTRQVPLITIYEMSMDINGKEL